MEILLDLLEPKVYHRFHKLLESKTACIPVASYI